MLLLIKENKIMSYMIFEFQEGNLVLTDPKAKTKGRTKAEAEKAKLCDPLRNDTDDRYMDEVADLGCWDEDDSIDLEEAFI